MRHRLLERLGLSSEADHDEVRTGFVRLELQAHAGGGFEWLRKVERYEGAEGDEVSGGHPGDTVLEVVIAGMQPRNAIVTMAMGTEQIALGLLNGQIELWDAGGNRQERFRVGESPVSAVVLGSRGLRASYSGGLLTLFAGAGITGCVRLPAYFARVLACGPDVLVWSGREAWVVEGKGRVVWRARFGKQIGGAVVHRVGFDVLAGHLFSFRRTRF